MKRTKYFINTVYNGCESLKRIKEGVVTFCCDDNKPWDYSGYSSDDLNAFPFKQITRDEARKLYPKAFRKTA